VVPALLVTIMVFACQKSQTDSVNDKVINEKQSSVLEGNDSVTTVLDAHNNEIRTIKDKDGNLIEEKVYFMVDEMPEFIGGEDALRMFMAQNVKYPVKAKETGTEGKVFVQFVVNAFGNVEQVKAIAVRVPIKKKNEIGEVTVVGYTEVYEKNGKAFGELEKEAERIVSSLPDWKPGKQDGQNVSVSFTVPINFLLQ
jgi:hypothetical protein